MRGVVSEAIRVTDRQTEKAKTTVTLAAPAHGGLLRGTSIPLHMITLTLHVNVVCNMF